MKQCNLQVSLRADFRWEDRCADTSGGRANTHLLILSVHAAKSIAQCALASFLACDTLTEPLMSCGTGQGCEIAIADKL